MFSLLLVLESDFAKNKRSDRPSNTALPKRDAPISLGSLQDALCITMCNCARCKVQCAIVQCAIVQGALMHCVVGGELVLGCALRLKHSDVPCADALMRSLVDDELN